MIKAYVAHIAAMRSKEWSVLPRLMLSWKQWSTQTKRTYPNLASLNALPIRWTLQVTQLITQHRNQPTTVPISVHNYLKSVQPLHLVQQLGRTHLTPWIPRQGCQASIGSRCRGKTTARMDLHRWEVIIAFNQHNRKWVLMKISNLIKGHQLHSTHIIHH